VTTPHCDATGATAEIEADSSIWLLDRAALADLLADIEVATPRLSADEKQRAAAMADQQLSQLWSAGRVALRLLLEAECGATIRQQPFSHDRSGRPFLERHGLDFSIADSGPHMMIGLATVGRIGVDLEQRRALKMAPLRVELIIAAGEGLGSTPAEALQSWTRIEAFAKAAGPSLAAILSRLGIQGHGEGMLAADIVRTRSCSARAAAGIEVLDLQLPQGLVGAVARASIAAKTRPPPDVRMLDFAEITRLAR